MIDISHPNIIEILNIEMNINHKILTPPKLNIEPEKSWFGVR